MYRTYTNCNVKYTMLKFPLFNFLQCAHLTVNAGVSHNESDKHKSLGFHTFNFQDLQFLCHCTGYWSLLHVAVHTYIYWSSSSWNDDKAPTINTCWVVWLSTVQTADILKLLKLYTAIFICTYNRTRRQVFAVGSSSCPVKLRVATRCLQWLWGAVTECLPHEAGFYWEGAFMERVPHR